MGLFWDLMQQGQISDQRDRADSIEGRITHLENELHQTRKQLYDLMCLLEKEFGRDINGDGKIGQ